MTQPLDKPSRSRFILMATVAFAVFSLAWIFLSDKLLANFADMQSMEQLSTAKGFFYVGVTTALFYLAMRAVPAALQPAEDTLALGALQGFDSSARSRWLGYFFAVLLPLSLLLVHTHMMPDFVTQPIAVMLVLPIIISALLGGFWPGMLATAISALGWSYVATPPIHSFAIERNIDLLKLAFLIGNGLAVSGLSEVLRQTLSRANAQRRLLNAVVSGTSDAIYVKDTQGRYLLVNKAGANFIGRPVSAIVGRNDTELFPAESARLMQASDNVAMAGESIQVDEEVVTAQDGNEFVFMITKGPIRDEQGRIAGLFGISRNVTERRHAEWALQSSEATLRAAQRLAGVGNWTWSRRTDTHYWSQELYRILGRDPTLAPAPYSDAQHYFTPQSWAQISATVQQTLKTGESYQCDAEVVRPDGSRRWVTLRGEATRNPDGVIESLQGTVQDITERKTFELAMMEAATVFESSDEGIMVVSPEQRITRVNPAFTRITGYTAHEACGQTPRLLSSGRHGPAFFKEMWDAIGQHGVWRGEISNKRKNGEVYPQMLAISVVRDEAGALQHHIGVFWDISQLKAHEAELERIAHYDPLTGSPNRLLLADRLDAALAHANQTARSLAVCFLDLDDFKAINDEHGHVLGDQLLVRIAQNLTHILRANDTLARLGGDEFVLLLADIATPQEGEQRLQRVLAAVNAPIVIGNTTFRVSASLGVSLYPQDRVDADTLLRHADQAMYQAKEGGRNRYHLFDLESDREAQQRRAYLTELRQALASDEFVLHYQPKVNLISGEIVGMEALARWQSPTRGLLQPAQFLPDMDASTLEKPFGEWVIRTALAQAAVWRAHGHPLCVSVNISAYHLLQSDFYAQLQRALALQPGLPPSDIELEVLETAAIRDMDAAVAIMLKCRALGVHFSLDDFGTGYSSLTYLRKLPVDVLKIDQSFVRGMLDNPDDLGIVQGVVRLAQSFNREVIAEGVETLAHGAALLRLGCYLAQGYGIARPMPVPQVLPWCEQWTQEQRWLTLSP